MFEAPAIIGALAGIASATITVIGFYYARRSYRDSQVERISKLETGLQNALQEAAEANQAAKDCHSAITVQQSAFHLYQLGQASESRKLATSDDLSHVEDRLMSAIKEYARTTTEAVNNLSRRVDGIADASRT